MIEIMGLSGDPTFRSRIVKRLNAALAPLRVKPVAARVTFFDEDGPKGGVAIRCALTVRLPYRPTVRAEHTSETGRLAFDGAFATLERQIARYREIGRESQRRPKKYYVAKRLLMAGLGSTKKR